MIIQPENNIYLGIFIARDDKFFPIFLIIFNLECL